MGILANLKAIAELPPPEPIESTPAYREPVAETTHCGRLAVLECIDDDGHAWYRTTRAYGGGVQVCYVRDTFLDVEVPFDR